LGYDEILGGKEVKREYKMGLYRMVEEEVRKNCGEENVEYLRWIVGSLIVSLIPLHHNEKCVEYDRLLADILRER